MLDNLHRLTAVGTLERSFERSYSGDEEGADGKYLALMIATLCNALYCLNQRRSLYDLHLGQFSGWQRFKTYLGVFPWPARAFEVRKIFSGFKPLAKEL